MKKFLCGLLLLMLCVNARAKDQCYEKVKALPFTLVVSGGVSSAIALSMPPITGIMLVVMTVAATGTIMVHRCTPTQEKAMTKDDDRKMREFATALNLSSPTEEEYEALEAILKKMSEQQVEGEELV